MELIHAEQAVSEAAHELALRGECNETDMSSPAPHALVARMASSSALGTVTSAYSNITLTATRNVTVYRTATDSPAVTQEESTVLQSSSSSYVQPSPATGWETAPAGTSVPVSYASSGWCGFVWLLRLTALQDPDSRVNNLQLQQHGCQPYHDDHERDTHHHGHKDSDACYP